MTKADEALAKLGELYRQRNVLYKDNYKRFGSIMLGLFPEGLMLKSEGDFNRMALFVHVLTKVTRYATQFDNGGHADSLDDLSVYSQMLAEVDRDYGEASELHKEPQPPSEFIKEYIKNFDPEKFYVVPPNATVGLVGRVAQSSEELKQQLRDSLTLEDMKERMRKPIVKTEFVNPVSLEEQEELERRMNAALDKARNEVADDIEKEGNDGGGYLPVMKEDGDA